MSFENKYPYTDFHELNLDWFLKEFKKVMDEWAQMQEDFGTLQGNFDTLEGTVQAFIDYVNNYFDNLDVQQEINNKLNQMAADGTLSALIQPLFDTYKAQIDNTVNNQNSRITILEGRMDEFSSLTEGSTTGDAELADIRVAADGLSYATAGDAVRGQIVSTRNALLDRTLGFMPDDMVDDIGKYEAYTGLTVNLDYRYDQFGVLTSAENYAAIKKAVTWGDRVHIKGAAAGSSNTFGVNFFKGDEVILRYPQDEAYNEYLDVPYDADNVRITCTKAGYSGGQLVFEHIVYDSIANKDYVENEIKDNDIKSLIPLSSYNSYDNKRYGANGLLVDALNYFAIDFTCEHGEKYAVYGANIGSSATCSILFCNGNTVVSSITNSGVGPSGRYDFTIPSGINNVRLTGILLTKYAYPVFKEVRLADGCITGNGYKNGTQHTYIVGEGFMPTIQCACDMASDDDIIFIKSGTYEENVHIWNKKRHLIGEDVNTTFIVDHIGNYRTPPLEMNIGSLSNITLIEDGEDSDQDPYEDKQLYAYCMHVEAINANTEVFDVTNCRFINAVHAAVGIGLQKDYTIRFRDCVFETSATSEGSEKERGAFFCHMAITENTPTNQHVIVENSIISSADNIAILLGTPQAATGTADYRFSGCTAWSGVNGTSDDSVLLQVSAGATGVFSKTQSYGNTIAILNS